MINRNCVNSEISYPLLAKDWLSIGSIDVVQESEQQGIDFVKLARLCKEESQFSPNVINITTPSYRKFSPSSRKFSNFTDRDRLSEGLRKRLRFQHSHIYCNDFKLTINDTVKTL